MAHQAVAGVIVLLAIAITSPLLGPCLQLFLVDASPEAATALKAPGASVAS